MDQNSYLFEKSAPGISLGRYAAKTYLLMFVGLVVTFAVSLIVMYTGWIYQLAANMGIWLTLLLLEVVTVIILSASIAKLKPAAAGVLFMLYAILNGVTLSALLVYFEAGSAMIIFAVTAAVFGIMAIWGYTTKQDLSGWRKVLLFGLLGLIIMAVLGLFLNLSQLEMIISFAGVAVFLGFTAYDTQKMKKLYEVYQNQPEILNKASIISALQLYLDFINLFIYLLRLLGKRN